ncbi:MAG: hypothetical protein M1828_002030 [Chrysothrix sp. TS-e1954]|nr:MAG: hypothetical protein M1828_002030 [Chrysothrix sp. TS-e1954]
MADTRARVVFSPASWSTPSHHHSSTEHLLGPDQATDSAATSPRSSQSQLGAASPPRRLHRRLISSVVSKCKSAVETLRAKKAQATRKGYWRLQEGRRREPNKLRKERGSVNGWGQVVDLDEPSSVCYNSKQGLSH